ncbi:MAG: PfkB family carbohydrate kinase [Solirubrobacteraceae bacterium]
MPAGRPRVAVVGHVEWVEFVAVPRLPASGEIVHATGSWEEAAGGGAVAAVQLARLAGGCDFFTTFGHDETGARARAELERRGVTVHAIDRPEAQRRAITFVDAAGERTIAVLGDRLVPAGSDPLPWDRLAGADAVYVTGGDAAAIRAARAARVLVATPRASDVLAEAGVAIDALVFSGGDAVERAGAERLGGVARTVVETAGAEGGTWRAAGGTMGRWPRAPLAGRGGDAYGCGDSFAAGLTLGLGRGDTLADAVGLGARCGAACRAGRGPYGAPMPAP